MGGRCRFAWTAWPSRKTDAVREGLAYVKSPLVGRECRCRSLVSGPPPPPEACLVSEDSERHRLSGCQRADDLLRWYRGSDDDVPDVDGSAGRQAVIVIQHSLDLRLRDEPGFFRPSAGRLAALERLATIGVPIE